MSAKFETLAIPIESAQNIKMFLEDNRVEFFCVYRGVLVFFDDDKDCRTLEFIDNLPDDKRLKLFAVYEHEGTISMAWKRHPPKGYREDDYLTVCQDDWFVAESVKCADGDLLFRQIPAPFHPIGEKVCVVRGDAFMIRRWLSMVGFSFDSEAKAWTQTVQVDAMGRGKFQFKHREKFEIWDLSDLVDACPRWETSRNLSVSFE